MEEHGKNKSRRRKKLTGFTGLERINIGKETGDKNFGLKILLIPSKKRSFWKEKGRIENYLYYQRRI